MIEVRLGKLLPGQQAKRSVTAKPLVQDAAVYAPAEPRIAKLERGAYGYPTLQIEGSGKGIVYNIYRNGQLVGPRISAANGPTAVPAPRLTCATRWKRCTPNPATAATTACLSA
jgi:hypothetical protein